MTLNFPVESIAAAAAFATAFEVGPTKVRLAM